MRRTAATVVGLVLASAAFAPLASADEEIRAIPGTQYSAREVTIDQGEAFTFRNLDIQDHDVTSVTRGPDGKVLFNSELIGTGESSFVEGSQYLTEGHYPFVCSIHANMTGTLHVTSAGTPKPRPGAGGGAAGAPDRTPPKLSVRLRSTRASTVRRFRELVAEVRVDEAAKVALTATARSRRRTVKIATGAVQLTTAGTRRPELRLTRAGARLLRSKRRLPVTISAKATDSSGNKSSARARGTLKR